MYSLNTQDTAWRIIDGEAVVINTISSVYYSLNESGTYVLCRLVRNQDEPEAIAKAISRKYSKSLDEVRGAVDQIVERLLSENLLLQASPDGKSAAEALDGNGELPKEYNAPELSRHGELEQLILSGE